MAQICELTGIKPMYGNKVSHANNKTKRRQFANLKKKKYFIAELSRSVTLTLSTRAIRSIEKMGGIAGALLSASDETMSTRLKKLRSDLKN